MTIGFSATRSFPLDGGRLDERCKDSLLNLIDVFISLKMLSIRKYRWVILIAGCAISPISFAASFTHLFIFGDSLSDTGNRASTSLPFVWPYYKNRVSNGPVAVDQLGARLSLPVDASLHLVGQSGGTNYAVAGAIARGTGSIDLDRQVDAFLARFTNQAPTDALYVMMIGANDVRDAIVTTNSSAANQIVDNAAAQVKTQLNRLIAAGARHIAVANIPDLGATPEARIVAQQNGDPGLIARATQLSQRFNNQLSSRTQQVELASGIDLIEFDFFVQFNSLLANASALGFTNTTDACFEPDSLGFHPDCFLGAGFDRFVFFDELHPTAKTHKLIGNALFDAIDSHVPSTTGNGHLGLEGILLLLLDD